MNIHGASSSLAEPTGRRPEPALSNDNDEQKRVVGQRASRALPAGIRRGGGSQPGRVCGWGGTRSWPTRRRCRRRPHRTRRFSTRRLASMNRLIDDTEAASPCSSRRLPDRPAGTARVITTMKSRCSSNCGQVVGRLPQAVSTHPATTPGRPATTQPRSPDPHTSSRSCGPAPDWPRSDSANGPHANGSRSRRYRPRLTRPCGIP